MVETEQFCAESRRKSSVTSKCAGSPRKNRELSICVLLVLVTCACYWPVTTHGFISLDDFQYVRENAHVKAGLTWAGVLWAFTTGYACNWHPVTWISHMIDCQLYGLSPAGHHFTSLLLHVFNSLLLFLWLKSITRAVWRSAFVAALFAWHPLHVESVAWVAERKDVLSTLFFVLTLWAYTRYAHELRSFGIQNPKSKIKNPAALAYCLALVFFALGLMSKPMLVTLPFVLLLLDVWPLRRLSPPSLRHSITPPFQSSATPSLRLFREKLPFFALALASSMITYFVQQAGGAVSSLTILPLRSRLANALVAYVQYLGKTVWPTRLAGLYPYSRHLSLGVVMGAVLVLALLSAASVWVVRRRSYLFVGLFWFLGTLVPVIGLTQVGLQSMADRYMYTPSIGLFIIAAWGLTELAELSFASIKLLSGSRGLGLARRRAAIPPLPSGEARGQGNSFDVASAQPEPHLAITLLHASAAALALVACLYCTSVQMTYWQNSESLFRRAIRVTSGNYVAYDCLGNIAESQGRRSEALALYVECVRLKPAYAEGQRDLGTLLLREGNLEGAAKHLSRALKEQPSLVDAHINLGKLYLQQNRLGEAEAHFEKAVALAPDDLEAEYAWGTVLTKLARLDEALTPLRAAVRLKPEFSEARINLGVALMMQGKPAEGLVHLDEALRLNPKNAEAAFNLGLAMLELNHPDEAAAKFTQAARLEPDLPRAQYYLALALARGAKAGEAMVHAERARDLAQAAGQQELAAKAESLLRLCQSGESFPSSL